MAIIKINMKGPDGSIAAEENTEFVWNELNFLFGTSGADVINKIGDSRQQVIYTGDGADIVIGGERADYIDGGEGNDTLRGSKGSDTIIGGEGADLISADAAVNDTRTGLVSGTLETFGNRPERRGGQDTIFGANGADTIDGGSDARRSLRQRRFGRHQGRRRRRRDRRRSRAVTGFMAALAPTASSSTPTTQPMAALTTTRSPAR